MIAAVSVTVAVAVSATQGILSVANDLVMSWLYSTIRMTSIQYNT